MGNGGRTARALLLLLLGTGSPIGCFGPSMEDVATGVRVEGPSGLSLVVPPQWDCRQLRKGTRLIHRTPVGNGYPTLQIEKTDGGAASLGASGKGFRHPLGPGEYRYSRWGNPRGHGYRLDALIRGQQATYLVHADLWDEGDSTNEDAFDSLFWPVIASLEDTTPPLSSEERGDAVADQKRP